MWEGHGVALTASHGCVVFAWAANHLRKGMHSGQKGQAGGVGLRVNTTSSDASGMMDWGMCVCVCITVVNCKIKLQTAEQIQATYTCIVSSSQENKSIEKITSVRFSQYVIRLVI